MKLSDFDNITTKPGVYLWKNKYGSVIYVGKAKNLKNRMRQYFRGMLNSYKTLKLIKNIDSYEIFITNSEKEALILERNLIEKYKPNFNILLIDDKRYPYIKLSLLNNDLDIKMVRRFKKQGNSFFYGPFPNGYGARTLINLLIRETKFEKGLPILNKDNDFWKKQFEKAKNILSSNNNFFIKELTQKMYLAANNFQFEIANQIKHSISFLEEMKINQIVELTNDKNIDVIGFSSNNDYIFISILFYRYGSLLSKENLVLEKINDEKETIREFINEYYNFNMVPNKLIIPFELNQNDINFEGEIIFPKKGIYKNILQNAIINASEKKEIKVLEYEKQKDLSINNIHKLEKLLNIKSAKHFLVIDNSNLNNYSPISAIISYKNGLKDKKSYKKFNLETGNRKADVEYMNEAIRRYFSKKNNLIPNLLMVDGGLAQVREVKKVLNRLNINLNVIGLVKNEKHITDHIINLEEKKQYINDATLLLFLRSIQEEVDRFAKFHYRSLRTKNTLGGFLLSVRGIGPKMEQKLLNHFKNYSNIYNATEAELAKIIPLKVVKNLKESIKKNT